MILTTHMWLPPSPVTYPREMDLVLKTKTELISTWVRRYKIAMLTKIPIQTTTSLICKQTPIQSDVLFRFLLLFAHIVPYFLKYWNEMYYNPLISISVKKYKFATLAKIPIQTTTTRICKKTPIQSASRVHRLRIFD